MPHLRAGFVQGRPRVGRPDENLEHGLALAATLDAELVVLPELWSSGYVFSSHAEVASLAEDARTGPPARSPPRRAANGVTTWPGSPKRTAAATTTARSS